MLAEQTALRFLSAFYGGDRVAARALMHEDFDFPEGLVAAERVFFDAARLRAGLTTD